MKQKSPFNRTKIIFYLILTILISVFFITHTVDIHLLRKIPITPKVWWGILGAIGMLLIRDIGYVLRLLLVTEYKISIRQSFKIIMLWEFGSAITPGMIGGKAFAIYLLVKNRIHIARASSMVLIGILLDELIFVLLFPILYIIYGAAMITPDTSCRDWVMLESKLTFLKNISYLEFLIVLMLSLIMCFVIISFVGVFLFPGTIRSLIIKGAKWPLISRWNHELIDFAQELYNTSLIYRQKSIYFWIKLILFTLMSWSGRYMVGVMIVWGFSHIELPLGLIYAKQYALWLMFYIPTSPGSSGLAEALFMAFYCPYFIDGISGGVATIWRLVSYYVYLAIGIGLLVFPAIFHKKSKKITS